MGSGTVGGQRVVGRGGAERPAEGRSLARDLRRGKSPDSGFVDRREKLSSLWAGARRGLGSSRNSPLNLGQGERRKGRGASPVVLPGRWNYGGGPS